MSLRPATCGVILAVAPLAAKPVFSHPAHHRQSQQDVRCRYRPQGRIFQNRGKSSFLLPHYGSITLSNHLSSLTRQARPQEFNYLVGNRNKFWGYGNGNEYNT